MPLAHHSLVAWQRADDLFVELHQPGRTRLNFLNTARASLAEVGYCIHVARRLGYITAATATELESAVKQVGAPLVGLMRSARLALFARAGASGVFLTDLLTHFV